MLHCLLPCPAIKIAQTWFSRLLFPVNKLSWRQGQSSIWHCLRGIAHQIKGATTTNTKSHNSLFRSQRANGPVTFRLGDFRGTAICAQLTCRLEQLWSCSLVRCMQLCTRVSQPAFKPGSPAYQPDKITCTRIVRFPDLLQSGFPNPTF